MKIRIQLERILTESTVDQTVAFVVTDTFLWHFVPEDVNCSSSSKLFNVKLV